MNFLFMVSGYSGTGKDAVCNILQAEVGAQQLGMTDPARRHMMELYGWTEQQMFGPSAYRNAGDPNTPKDLFLRIAPFLQANPDLSGESGEFFLNLRKHSNLFPASSEIRRYFLIPDESPLFKWDHGNPIDTKTMIRSSQGWIFSDCDPQFFLSPREALQQYCEKMNQLYEYTWVRSVFIALERITLSNESYDRVRGFSAAEESKPADNVYCLADLRHWHEIDFADKINQDWLRVVKIRVRRPSIPNPPYQHRSEVEQSTIPDSKFDFVIDNDGSLEDLHRKVIGIYRTVERG